MVDVKQQTCFSALKIRLKPTKEQENFFWRCCGISRFAYNWALFKIESNFDNGVTKIDAWQIKKEFHREKRENPELSFLYAVSCDVAKKAIDNCCDAYFRYFKKRKESGYEPYTKKKIEHSKRTGKVLTKFDITDHPKPKTRKNSRKSFYVDWFQVKINEDSIHIPRIGKIKTRNSHHGVQTFPLKSLGKSPKFVNAHIAFDGKYWIFSAGYEFEIQDNTDKRSDPIGIDLGIKETAVCSDGTVFQNINKSNRLKKLQKQKKRMQRKFSRKLRLNNHRKSENSKKLIRKLQLLDRKITNIKTDFRHKMTSEIVKRNPSFVILETLNVHGMMKNKHLSRSIWEQGWYSITTYLQQKCERHQIELIKADRWYASSKTCSNCKSIKQDLTLKDRIFKCPTCGFIIDRDLNAAINLKTYGLTLKNIVA